MEITWKNIPKTSLWHTFFVIVKNEVALEQDPEEKRFHGGYPWDDTVSGKNLLMDFPPFRLPGMV